MLEKTPKPEDRVNLKPVLGVRPGVYIAIACSFIILLALFFLLLYPGIAHPGAMVVFTSEPAGAALRVDDVYAGASPCRVFVPKGEHLVSVILPGFDTEHISCVIPSRFFASVLFPRRYDLNVSLSAAEPERVLAASAFEYAAWSFGGEPTAAWQIPLCLSEGVYRAGAPDSAGILAAAARFAVTRAALRDLVRAQTLAVNGGNAPSPLTLAHSVRQAAAFLADNPGSAAWLADTLPYQDSAAVLISSAWYQNQIAAFAGITAGEALAARPGPELPANRIRVGGLLFNGLSGGILARGEPFPHQTPVGAFLICTAEVPEPAYADFLDADPRWRAEQRETLVRQGLATNEYLADFGTASGKNPLYSSIRSASWYAAQAFCQWLSGKLPDSFSGWEVRLPTESEWEYAVKSSLKPGGPDNVFAPDNAWEWCADPYAPLPFLSGAPEAGIGSPEYSLRRGSWMNASESISYETRASLPPAACSPFVSFRPVIARKTGGTNMSR
ncbi:MAG: SUMF1/EgtB/PvdO family nonheme iron enzyme [Treponema sp.]|jgi:formylglycine-generating enzyme required for sulfatase activity|nr:SUMF1/EgtB/PvdO family nonheme iron enzyme [Treponema sp.]